MAATPIEMGKVAAKAADAKKAADIVLLDLASLSDVCDCLLICTATNRPQMEAVEDEVRERLRTNCNIKPFSVEGRAHATWILMDYGSLVVHIFQPEARDYYRLEELWGDAPRVSLDLEGVSASQEASVDSNNGDAF